MFDGLNVVRLAQGWSRLRARYPDVNRAGWPPTRLRNRPCKDYFDLPSAPPGPGFTASSSRHSA